jgi:hypothetical protein
MFDIALLNKKTFLDFIFNKNYVITFQFSSIFCKNSF